MKLAVFHLFNDYSGSPKVLRSILPGLLERGHEIELVTSRGGVLDEVTGKGLKRRSYGYAFSANPVKTLLRYTWVQARTFFMALKYTFRPDVTFYINTILPVGPALAGKLTGKRVVYHYHENAFVKSGFYRGLSRIMEKMADEIICVSAYQASFLKRKERVRVIPNALPEGMASRLRPDAERAFERKNVLMLSSLKGYKGTKEFISLASLMPAYAFTLVINDTEEEIDKWLKAEGVSCPPNLRIHPRTPDVTSFYNGASVVVNLSDPDLFIETFGLTALEAMSAGLPVIVPQVGGIAEMVEDGVNGYKVNCHDTDALRGRLEEMLTSKSLYLLLAKNALVRSYSFNRETTLDALESTLKK